VLKNDPLIIGITGAFGSGKSTAAEILESFGFIKISLAWFLEEELKNQGRKEIFRRSLQDLGNKWRKECGPGILAKKAIALIKEKRLQKVAIEGFRNNAEIEELRKFKNFKLIGIVVNRKLRFERLQKLNRREQLNWDLFNKLDNRDLGIGEGRDGLQVAICLALSDIFIENNCGLKELKNKITDAVNEKTHE
jgi:dephospho-CoA kinase